MGQVLDSILKKQLVDGPEALSADYESEAIDIDNRENEYAIQFVYDNGINVNMILSLEVSNNKVDWSEVTDSQQAITDSAGSHIYDLAGSGTSYVRLKITVLTGSLDIQELLYVGRRRH